MKLIKKEPKRVYISGPMTGMPNMNHDAFFAMEKRLEDSGYDVVNPARLTMESVGGSTRQDFYRQDFRALTDCDAIMLLHNWVLSHGARFERQLAVEIGLQVFHEEDFKDEN